MRSVTSPRPSFLAVVAQQGEVEMVSIAGTDGNDILTGGDENDSIRGWKGNDQIFGGAGNDYLDGWYGNDTIYGGTGNDYLLGDLGDDFLYGEDGDDYLQAGEAPGTDFLSGGAGNDMLVLNGYGTKIAMGDAGDDLFECYTGIKLIYGGDGIDTVSYSDARQGVKVDLKSGVGSGYWAEGDTYFLIENIVGGLRGDVLIGNDLDNIIHGNDGNDQIFGGVGNDVISGGKDGDKLDGGIGVNTLDYTASPASVKINLSTNTGSGGDATGDTFYFFQIVDGSSYADTLIGGLAAEILNGNNANDTLKGYGGADTLDGGAGADKLYGGAGKDTASYANAVKGVVANLSEASLNTNDAKGDTYSSIENLLGSSCNDKLTGSTVANKIWGGVGNDKLYGGLGHDLLIGGSGKDKFIFDTELGSTNIDKVDDFIDKDDTIWLDDGIFAAAGTVGDLASGAFYAGTKAHDSSDRIVYDKTTGKLWYDVDGTGATAAVQFALIDKALTLTASHFDIIA